MKIKAKINELGFITDYAIFGDIDNSIEVEIPDDFDEKYYRCYKIIQNECVFDSIRKEYLDKEQFNYRLRQRREEECFSVINRGGLWYDLLTGVEKAELLDWYTAWLDVTLTGIIPEKPVWLK